MNLLTLDCGLTTMNPPRPNRRNRVNASYSSTSHHAEDPAGRAGASPRPTPAPRDAGAAPGGPAHDADLEPVDRQFAINLARGLQVLRAFTPSEPILGNRELADRTGLPKATISRLTYTLTLLGYLTRSEKFQRYRLAAGVLSLGYPMLASLQIRQIARPFMERLARETRCTVNLGMRDRLNVVYIDTCRPVRDNHAHPDIGSTRPLLSTALGRALLIGESASEREAVLNRLRVDDPAAFAADFPYWEADRTAFARRGFCLSHGDWNADVHAIAVPIHQPLREDGVAMNCTIVRSRLKEGQLEHEIAPRLIEAARQIERVCGMQ
jgi:DNA-binding IclR family transcriptional regulator